MFWTGQTVQNKTCVIKPKQKHFHTISLLELSTVVCNGWWAFKSLLVKKLILHGMPKGSQGGFGKLLANIFIVYINIM